MMLSSPDTGKKKKKETELIHELQNFISVSLGHHWRPDHQEMAAHPNQIILVTAGAQPRDNKARSNEEQTRKKRKRNGNHGDSKAVVRPGVLSHH